MAIRPLLACALAVASCGSLAMAAGPLPDGKRQAAQSFDEGVKHAARAEYDAAARAFLRADELAPNATALTNAMAAARRGNADLLLAEAAQRALDRGDAALATAAREALADAEKRLARLELSCEPSPCKLRVDGNLAAAGKRYVLPGDHAITASGERGADVSERVTAVAGTQHRVALSLRVAEPAPSSSAPPPVTTAPPRPSSAPAASTVPERSPDPAPPTRPTAASGRPLPPGAFYAGAAVTLVLAGVTTWSGLGTLSSKPSAGTAYTQQDVDTFHANIRRTNYLLAGTAIVGAMTAAIGLTLVDWGGDAPVTVGVSVTPGRAALVIGGPL